MSAWGIFNSTADKDGVTATRACCACGGGRKFVLNTVDDCKCNANFFDSVPGSGVQCEFSPRWFTPEAPSGINSGIIDTRNTSGAP